MYININKSYRFFTL